ncbi:nucleotidyltransferase family protein [Amycolatopsis sp. FBCC-B4732]|uniref:nucleotidyltransferase family protein n=1 Tax=Amycolatopsis sp. FBCC-B4732 TaxID=3079339 RepID=UPI001FF668D2|nr:nucleotidyltransferase family protein [Amycolatopsis sp. FBCC-B4732]UOX89421.1 nucleotidyltransferase family protein [Amycolatopsis sp. FBCC-B4732]
MWWRRSGCGSSWGGTKSSSRCWGSDLSWEGEDRVIRAAAEVRLEPDGSWHFYAPHGLDDLFAMVVRPNPVLAPCEAFERKAARWRSRWPEIVLMFSGRSRMWTSLRSRLWSVVPRSVTP